MNACLIVFLILSALHLFYKANPVFGQIQLLGQHLENPTPPELTNIGQRPLIYMPEKDDSPVLYFTPFFVFENTLDGSLKVDVDEPLRSGAPYKVRLTLLVSPNWLLESIATEVRRWVEGQSDTKYNRYKSIDAKSLIPTEFTYLAVAEKNEKPLFKPVVRDGITTQQPVYLEAELETQQQAEELANKLKNRKASLVFTVQYRLYARITVSESSVRVASISVSQTEGVKSLMGAGRAFRFSVSPTTGDAAVGTDQTVLTREQAETFKAHVNNNIVAEYVIENQADIEIIKRELDRFFDLALKEKEVAFKQVGQEITKLSAYGFSPLDLTPDKIQKIAVDAKNALQTEDQSKFSFNASASVKAFGFGGSATVGLSRETLKKSMEDKGWQFGGDVEAYVPKALKVYVVDTKQLEQAFSISLSVSRRLREISSLGAEITTAKGFSDKGAELGFTALTGKNFVVELEKLSKRMNGLEEMGPRAWLYFDTRALNGRGGYPNE